MLYNVQYKPFFFRRKFVPSETRNQMTRFPTAVYRTWLIEPNNLEPFTRDCNCHDNCISSDCAQVCGAAHVSWHVDHEMRNSSHDNVAKYSFIHHWGHAMANNGHLKLISWSICSMLCFLAFGIGLLGWSYYRRYCGCSTLPKSLQSSLTRGRTRIRRLSLPRRKCKGERDYRWQDDYYLSVYFLFFFICFLFVCFIMFSFRKKIIVALFRLAFRPCAYTFLHLLLYFSSPTIVRFPTKLQNHQPSV